MGGDGVTTVGLLTELLLDGVLLALCALGLFGHNRDRVDMLLPLACAAAFLTIRTIFGHGVEALNYVLLPTDHIIAVLLIAVPILLLNSLWFHPGEGYTFWGTVAQLALYLLLREICLAALNLAGLDSEAWVVYGCRVMSLLLWAALWAANFLGWLREQLDEGDALICAISCSTLCSTLLVLLMFWRFQMWRSDSDTDGFWICVAGFLTLLVMVDGAVLLWDQRRIQERQRVRLLEHYLPMVEELVESVRARQHEFNNRMMAVSAAVSTADTLDGAREAVAALAGRIALDKADRELLRCDSKVISGMLFGKIKQAELRHVRVELTVAGSFLHRSLSENDWVEVIGALLDNALEASEADSTVYLRASDENGALRFTVSNPCYPKSNVELAEMFRRGWSTKAGQGRGYGLYNVRRLVEQRNGKIITRNEEIDGENFLTIGVLIE